MTNKWSCFDCVNASVTAFLPATRETPGEPPEAECKLQIPEVVYELSEDEMARDCGAFEPRLIEKCGECGRDMFVEEWKWSLWAMEFDNIPVCSQLCKGRAEYKFDKEMRPRVQYPAT